jgi:putative membrane protein
MSINEQVFKKWIIALSVVIPVAVALLFKIKIDGFDTKFLPPIYAFTNGLTAVLLILALLAVKRKNIDLHQKLIKVCLGLSVLFLVLYVARHITASDTVYGDINHDGVRDDSELAAVGNTLYMYLFFLITHISLSVVVIPFVLFTYMRGVLNQVEKHRKLAKITFPIWLYVAVTGVIVYYMIAPYY